VRYYSLKKRQLLYRDKQRNLKILYLTQLDEVKRHFFVPENISFKNMERLEQKLLFPHERKGECNDEKQGAIDRFIFL
jgi:hypothetical protein